MPYDSVYRPPAPRRQTPYVRSGPAANSPYYAAVKLKLKDMTPTRNRPVAPANPWANANRGVTPAAQQAVAANLNNYAADWNKYSQTLATAPKAADPGANAAATDTKPPTPATADFGTTDPLLAKIKALSTQNLQDAEAGALSAKKQLAIRLGSSRFARDTIGDENTALAAEQNPLSLFAQLQRQNQQQTRDSEEGLNKGNLFFSGHRGQVLSDLGRMLLEQQANAEDQARSQYGEIMSGLMTARNNERNRVGDAENDAYLRQLAAAKDSGAAAAAATGGGGGGDGGNGGNGGGDAGNAGGVFDPNFSSHFQGQFDAPLEAWQAAINQHNGLQVPQGQRLPLGVLLALQQGREQRLLGY
jgi:hypothetical protein